MVVAFIDDLGHQNRELFVKKLATEIIFTIEFKLFSFLRILLEEWGNCLRRTMHRKWTVWSGNIVKDFLFEA